MSKVYVIKRNGNKEPLNIEKIHRVVEWACENYSNVSPSEIELKSKLSFYNGITTRQIHDTLIRAAAELISEYTPNYQYVASRLINYKLRKEVYNQYEPIDLYTHVKRVVDMGFYTNELLMNYTKEEFDVLNSHINHDRDFDIAYAGMEQFLGKYLVQDRAKKVYLETPQMAFMLISMIFFMKYNKTTRLSYVKRFYDAISKFYISLPTPIIAGLRSTEKQYSSCVLIECDDSLDSINATSSAIVKYVSQRAGIGIGAGKIRAIGAPIRNGAAVHTGVVPFYRLFQSAVKSCSQGAIRNGAATLYFPFWHYEVENMLVLKNNKGIEENRVRHMDYAIQFNKLFYERLLDNKPITLFDPHEVKGLYEAFYENNDKFKELYEYYETQPVRKKEMTAFELFELFIQERKETGRIYLMNVDNVNNQGSFIPEKAPVRMSNLCTEITLPTNPLTDINDGREYYTLKQLNETYKTEYEEWLEHDKPFTHRTNQNFFKETVDSSSNFVVVREIENSRAEIALCTLSAINWGKISNEKQFEEYCDLIVRALDELLDYQDYPVAAARNATLTRRSLGIGITNFAFWMTKNEFKYSEPSYECLKKLHEYAEAWSYYLIKASVNLAKEKGACEYFEDTKYSLGLFPIDTYKKTVDELVSVEYKMDWAALREDMKKYGIRNSTLMAIMPCETSSQVSNSTNGIEPPRAPVSVKVSKDGVLKQVIPGLSLKKHYEFLWDIPNPRGYLTICAVLQKFIDQAISVNTSYNPAFFANNEIPISQLLMDVLFHYKYGGKTMYYFNTNDLSGDNTHKEEEEVLDTQKNESEVLVCNLTDDCSSCKI